MSLKSQNIIKIPIVVAIFTALLFGSFCFGLFHKTSMAIEETVMTDMVSINTQQICCGGSMSQHIKSWTSTFLVTPHDFRNNLALLALTLFMALVLMRSLFSPAATNSQLLSSPLYLRQKSNLFIFNPLKLAFARGILNTKVY